MNKEPTRFPLTWPAHRPRTLPRDRRWAKFKQHGRDLTVAGALDRIEAELGRMNGTYLLISTNVEPRLDGRPRSGQAAPTDPGVCVYFNLAGKPIALACDSYTTVEGNLGAVAAHLEATRAIERHGVATAAETLQAFSALPPPTAGPVAPAQRPWREVMGFGSTDPAAMDQEDGILLVQTRYRRAAKDLGAESPALAELNVARDAALAEIKASR
jgi:hypothetical protein